MKCENCGKPLSRNWGLKLCSKCLGIKMEATKPNPIDELYNPEITDLELNEHQGHSRPVIYLDEATTLLRAELQKARIDQVMHDFLTYNNELNNDESELIAVRDELLKELDVRDGYEYNRKHRKLIDKFISDHTKALQGDK